MLVFGNGPAQFFVGIPVPGIDPIIPDHLEMLFRDVLDEPPDKFKCGDGLGNQPAIFMAVLVESYIVTVI